MQDQAEAIPPPGQQDDSQKTSHWYECCLRRSRALPPDATRWDRLRHNLLCPPGVNLGRACIFLMAIPVIWLAGYCLTGQEMLPGGNLFKMYILFIACLLGGWLMEMISFPGLLGMLFVGMIVGNLERQMGWMTQPIRQDWSGETRGLALIVIFICAGLELNPEQLRRLSLTVIRLAFVPCAVEAVTIACISYFALGFPWTWGFMLGFALATSSTAVVVPCMLSIQRKGYGVAKGIPTLLIAASSIDDILAISIFAIFLGMTFSEGSIMNKMFMPFVEVIVGLLYGTIFGIILWFVPNRKDKFAIVEIRSMMLLFGGIAAYFGSIIIEMHSGGALGVLTMAFVASLGWRRQGYEDDNPVSQNFNYLWLILQPLLFGLIGTEMDFAQIKPTTIGYGLIVICGGLFIRCCASYVSLFGGDFNAKEKLFSAVAWMPKATVQAAIGPYALDAAKAMPDPNPQFIEWGRDIVTIVVMAILISASIGTIFIGCCSSKLLEKSTDVERKDSRKTPSERMDDNGVLDRSPSTAASHAPSSFIVIDHQTK
ncbi:unnamed protein product [Darwinula stevensoni]|uniref:Cation/H+ exchanger transmembrane domain-containing protein n=1 Tax=Darwinula stevensoni TaxID=69355 RepID=A0A7R8XEI5_9CRUS|nr:unnamed protein product [Darwinula stevensoni]CAG0895844.1 unnamed protein product [Darwinula stevensoni]